MLLLILAWLGLQGGIQQWPESHSVGQTVQTAAQFAYGILSVLAPVAAECRCARPNKRMKLTARVDCGMNLSLARRGLSTMAAIIMASYWAGCTSWRVKEAAPQRAAELRITLADGRRLLLHDPQVQGDSLVGFTVQEQGSASERVRVAFLTADLHRIEGRKLDGTKTGLAVIGLGAVVALVLALRNFQTTDPNH